MNGPENAYWIRSSTSSVPSFATCTRTSAASSVNDFAAAAPASASAATAAEERELYAPGVREADRRHLAVAGILDLEELPRPEAEHARDEHRGEGLDRVVVRQHRVVVDLPRDGDLVLRVLQLVLEVQEVLVRLQLRIRLGNREEPAERLAQQPSAAPASAGFCAFAAAARAAVTASNVPRSCAA